MAGILRLLESRGKILLRRAGGYWRATAALLRPVAARERLADKGPVPGYRLRLAAADWNNDGKLDLLVGHCESGESGESGPTSGRVFVFLRK